MIDLGLVIVDDDNDKEDKVIKGLRSNFGSSHLDTRHLRPVSSIAHKVAKKHRIIKPLMKFLPVNDDFELVAGFHDGTLPRKAMASHASGKTFVASNLFHVEMFRKGQAWARWSAATTSIARNAGMVFRSYD